MVPPTVDVSLSGSPVAESYVVVPAATTTPTPPVVVTVAARPAASKPDVVVRVTPLAVSVTLGGLAVQTVLEGLGGQTGRVAASARDGRGGGDMADQVSPFGPAGAGPRAAGGGPGGTGVTPGGGGQGRGSDPALAVVGGAGGEAQAAGVLGGAGGQALRPVDRVGGDPGVGQQGGPAGGRVCQWWVSGGSYGRSR